MLLGVTDIKLSDGALCHLGMQGLTILSETYRNTVYWKIIDVGDFEKWEDCFPKLGLIGIFVYKVDI